MTDRLAAARALLAGRGVSAPVSVAGTDGEIVTVTGPAGLRTRLADLAPELRALGFRYVALELDPDPINERRDT